MARTEYLYFAGKCKWAKLNAPDKFQKWSIVLYPNTTSLEKIKTLGLKNPIKKDEDGEYVVFSRPISKVIRGKVIGFAPPSVIVKDQEGRDMLSPNEQIGNGSDVTVMVDYYSYQTPQKETGHAARLSKVRVDNLVPFTPRSDLNDEEADAVAGLIAQPEQLF